MMRRLILALGLSAAMALGLTACKSPKAVADASVGDSFLAQNAKAPGVTILPDGLQYKVIQSGPATGAHPGPTDEVKVNYEGKLLNGQIFDSSYQRGVPADLRLDQVIPGWTEALQLMRPGDVWMIYLPAKLAYGDNSPDPSTIPENSVLIFKIQLIGALSDEPAKG